LTPFHGGPRHSHGEPTKPENWSNFYKRIPRFGVPEGLAPDRGPHFVAETTQGISRFLNMEWDLHTTETALR